MRTTHSKPLIKFVVCVADFIEEQVDGSIDIVGNQPGTPVAAPSIPRFAACVVGLDANVERHLKPS